MCLCVHEERCRWPPRRQEATLGCVGLLLLLLLAGRGARAECDHVKLVDCLSDLLDDYAKMLWRTQKNIIAMEDSDCEYVHQMGACIADKSHTRSCPPH